MIQRTKYYFISDVHLGLYPIEKSREREKKLVRWLDSIKPDACELFLGGDIFDFWHEHKHVIPKGFVRFFGKLAELSDQGVKISFFTGNHDVWAYSYLKEEMNVEIYSHPVERVIGGKKFQIGHGDGLNPHDKGYLFLKAAFTSKILQWIFARLHPNFAMWIGKSWSKQSRYSKGIVGEPFAGMKGEDQIQYALKTLETNHFDFFIYGHRHIPFDLNLVKGARIINLGDWIYSFTYAVFDGNTLELKQFEGNGEKIIRKAE